MVTLIQDSERPITIGTNDEAQAWVAASTLSDVAKADFFRFIKHFPQMAFYREDTLSKTANGKPSSYMPPEWLEHIRQVLTYVTPKEFVLARFDNLEEDGENWYTLYAGTYLKDLAYLDLERQLHADGLALQLIGERIDMPGILLAINDAAPNDQAIYEFNLESLWDFKQSNFPLSSAI
jgi:hypothetical protein